MEKSQNFFFRQAATICYAFLIFCPFFGLFITYPPFISPLFLRKFRAKNEIMRQKADESLQAAMVYAMSYTIKELVDKGSQIHPDTVAAYNQVIKGDV